MGDHAGQNLSGAGPLSAPPGWSVLPDVPARLSQIATGAVPEYMTLWHAAVAGRIPAVRRGRRLAVADTDLPLVAKVFGMELRAPTPTPAVTPMPKRPRRKRLPAASQVVQEGRA